MKHHRQYSGAGCYRTTTDHELVGRTIAERLRRRDNELRNIACVRKP